MYFAIIKHAALLSRVYQNKMVTVHQLRQGLLAQLYTEYFTKDSREHAYRKCAYCVYYILQELRVEFQCVIPNITSLSSPSRGQCCISSPQQSCSFAFPPLSVFLSLQGVVLYLFLPPPAVICPASVGGGMFVCAHNMLCNVMSNVLTSSQPRCLCFNPVKHERAVQMAVVCFMCDKWLDCL